MRFGVHYCLVEMRLLGFILGGVLRYIGDGEALYPLGNITLSIMEKERNLGKEKCVLVR
jgi:hypothetical protein